MRRFTWTCLGVGLALAAGLSLARAADTGASAPSLEQFLKIRTPGSASILPDGSMLVSDRPDGISQLYRFVPKTPAAPGDLAASYRPADMDRIRLTSFPDGLSGFGTSPDGRLAVLVHARGGNENTEITLLDLSAAPGAGMTTVFADPKVQATPMLWLKDGSGLIYRANDESPTDFHLYRYDFATKTRKTLLAREGSWIARDITRDGRRLLVIQFHSASDAECYELDVATGKLTDLTLKPPGGTAACVVFGYMPDEKSVLLESDYRDGVERLYLRDVAKGTVKEPLPALSKFELDGAIVNDVRDMMVAFCNEDGYGVAHVYSLPDFKPLPAPESEKGVLNPSEFKGHTLLWSLSNARTPGLGFATTWPDPKKGAAPATRQLTWAEDQGIDLSAFGLPELVHYKAFDGRDISAFLYLPNGVAKGTPVPFILNYHGGPEGQHRPTFNSTFQYYLTRGYGVMLPNVRGSTGYGREFQMLDDYQKRWDSVRDGVDAAEWLVKSGYAKPGRIATYGGSYGGFMSVACIVEDQERVERGDRKERLFGACVDLVGIVNMRTFLEKTSDYRRKLREVEYGPLADTTFLATVSSIRKVDKIQVPVFIGHGFNDPRVPVQEAMQLATALKDRGRTPRLFIAPDEGHGFAKLDNRIYFGERVATFLDETIGRAPTTARAQ